MRFTFIMSLLLTMASLTSCAEMFQIDKPLILSLDKSSSYFPGELLVTLTGLNFEPASVVKFGDKECLVQTFVTSTQINCVVPSYDVAGGTVDVSLTNPDGNAITLSEAFTYRPFTILTTIAGNGVTAGPWIDGTGDVATMNYPEAIMMIGQDIYIGDYNACMIRKINLSGVSWDAIDEADAVVSGVAGTTGVCGATDGDFVGQGLFTSIEWLRPYDTDKIIVADNDSLRLADLTTESITTLVTAPGASTYVGGLAVVEDDVYFTGGGDHVIYRYNLTTPATTAVVGDGTMGNTDGVGTLAVIASPYGLDVDYKKEYMYASSFVSQTIKQIRLSDFNVTTVLGTHTTSGSADGTGILATFNGPNAISAGDYLFISDYMNCTIRTANKTDWSVSTTLGVPADCSDTEGTVNVGVVTGTARLSRPWGIHYHPEWGVFFGVGGALKLMK